MIILVGASVLTCGCTPIEKTTSDNSYIPVEVGTAYPPPSDHQPQTRVESGYPGAETTLAVESSLPNTLSIPAPSTDSGIVTGVLLGESDNRPYIAPGLYLGKLIPSSDENSEVPPLIGLSTGSDPKAVQATDGAFLFTEVSPGEYIIIIWAPMSIVPIIDPETQSELIVIVEAGKVTDLGTLFVD